MRDIDAEDATNPQIIAEASEWLVEFESGDADPASCRRFDAWLRRSPEHVRAYLELLPIWKYGADARLARDSSPQALIAYARAGDTVVPWSAAESAAVMAPRRPTSRRPAVPLAVAAALVLAAAALFIWQAVRDGITYATGVGEQYSAVLPDGSTLQLNAVSRVHTRFTEHERRIELLQGQALFQVVRDEKRPFVVGVDGAEVRAVGTAFDVYRRPGGTVVTVVEGRVAVLSRGRSHDRLHDRLDDPSHNRLHDDPQGLARDAAAAAGSAGAGAVYLSAGEQLMLESEESSAAPAPKPVNIAVATAWTERRLVFEDASLAQVVFEFNRYNRRQMRLEDAALEAFPISAAFSSTDPASLIRFLAAQPGIRVSETGAEVRISRR